MRSLNTLAVMLAFTVGATASAQNSANKPLHVKTTNTGVAVINLDTAASTATWTGKKVTGQHTGTVSFKEGSFDFKQEGLVSGKVVIDLTTIKNTDLTDADYNKKLVDHLLSEDFFDAAKHPTATFTIKKFTELHTFAPGMPNGIAKGALTIRGVTRPHTAKLFYYPKDGGFEVKGKIEIDRTQFGLKYNSKKFFSAKKLGDKLINDKFEVDLNIVAKK